MYFKHEKNIIITTLYHIECQRESMDLISEKREIEM